MSSDNQVKLLGKLPTADANGLRHHADTFVEDPATMQLAIVLMNAQGMDENYDTGVITAKVRVKRIEVVVDPNDAKALKRLMLRALEQRTGKTVLPLDLEGDIDAIFEKFTASTEAGAVDPKTGEIENPDA